MVTENADAVAAQRATIAAEIFMVVVDVVLLRNIFKRLFQGFLARVVRTSCIVSNILEQQSNANCSKYVSTQTSTSTSSILSFEMSMKSPITVVEGVYLALTSS